MTLLSDELLGLIDELRGVVMAAREGNRRELQRVVRDVGADLREIARRVSLIEKNPRVDSDWARAVHDRYEGAADRAVANIVSDCIGQDFDPRGYFVYTLWGSDPNKPLYIGQSANILGRLGQHLGDGAKQEHVTRVSLLRCTDRRTMDATEMRLIRHHRPPWNTRGIYYDDRCIDPEPLRAIPDEDWKLMKARYVTAKKLSL